MPNSPVPVLMIDPERLRKEEDHNFWRNSLAALAGGVGGMGVGTLLVNPYEYVQSRKAEKRAVETHDNFMKNREVLETLRDLHTGKISWDQVNPEARPYLEAQYQEHQHLLNNRQSLHEALSEKPPADLRFFPGAQEFRLKRLLPSTDLFTNFRETIKHPAVSTGGLLGSIVAAYAADRYNDHRFYNMLKDEQTKQKMGNAILGREDQP